jgi:hypothetical protein
MNFDATTLDNLEHSSVHDLEQYNEFFSIEPAQAESTPLENSLSFNYPVLEANHSNNHEEHLHKEDNNSLELADKVFAFLWKLHEELLSKNEIIGSLTALQSIVQTAKVTFLPNVIVNTHIRIADLLLMYTENLEDAHRHLSKAVR